ncbi:hypothetical protein Tco_1377254 [Tanacetum coccineum]
MRGWFRLAAAGSGGDEMGDEGKMVGRWCGGNGDGDDGGGRWCPLCGGGCDGDVGGVIVAAVGRQPEEVEAGGGEWIWGSGRSGHEDNIWFRPERSPENFSGGGGMVAGGGSRREGWPDF